MKNHGNILLMSLFLFQPLVASDDAASVTLDADMSSLNADADAEETTTSLMSAVTASSTATTSDDESADDDAVDEISGSSDDTTSDADSSETFVDAAADSNATDAVDSSAADTTKSATDLVDDTTSDSSGSVDSSSDTSSSGSSDSVDSSSDASSDSSGSVDLQQNVATNFSEVAVPDSTDSSEAASTTDSLDSTDSSAAATENADEETATADPLASVTVTPELAIPVAPEETAVETPSTTDTDSSATTVTSTLPSTVTAAPAEDDVTLTVDDSQQIDLDTMTIGVGGNWLQKRVYYEKAAALYEEIQEEVNNSEDARLNFLSEINSLHQSIDSFYETVSFGQGQIKTLLDSYTTALSMEEERDGDLSEDELAMQQTIVDEQAQVTEIGEAISVIGDLDEKVDEVMQLVFTTIDSCRDYQSKAWDNFKDITQSLDDQKARTLYYEMENYSDNIEQQISYLNDTLFTFLKTTLGGQITSNINTVESALTDLQSKGVDLGAQIKSFFGEDIDTQAQRKQYEIDEAAKQAVEDYKKEAAEKQAKAEAQEKEEKQEALEGSFIYKFVMKVVCPLKCAWSWIVSHDAIRKPVEVIMIGGILIWDSVSTFLCTIGCWLSKLKFW